MDGVGEKKKKKGVETSEGKIMKKRGDYAFTFH